MTAATGVKATQQNKRKLQEEITGNKPRIRGPESLWNKQLLKMWCFARYDLACFGLSKHGFSARGKFTHLVSRDHSEFSRHHHSWKQQRLWLKWTSTHQHMLKTLLLAKMPPDTFTSLTGWPLGLNSGSCDHLTAYGIVNLVLLPRVHYKAIQ